jgi:hypothetical protein
MNFLECKQMPYCSGRTESPDSPSLYVPESRFLSASHNS